MDQETIQQKYDEAILYRNAFADVEDVCNAVMDGSMPATGKKPFYVGVNADGLMLGAHPYGDKGADFRAITRALPGFDGEDPISGKILEKTYQHLMNLLQDPDGDATRARETREQMAQNWLKNATDAIDAWSRSTHHELCIPPFELEGLTASEAQAQLEDKFQDEKGLCLADIINGVEDGPRGISQMFDTILTYLQWHQEQIRKPQSTEPALKPKNRW